MRNAKRQHLDGCRYRLAVSGAVAIECPHGYDVCPICDPCTCPKDEVRDVPPPQPSLFQQDATGTP